MFFPELPVKKDRATIPTRESVASILFAQNAALTGLL